MGKLFVTLFAGDLKATRQKLQVDYGPERSFLFYSFYFKSGQIIVHLSTLYRDPASTQQTLYPDGKKCAIPSLRQDTDPAKADTSQWRWRRGTQPSHIAGPL